MPWLPLAFHFFFLWQHMHYGSNRSQTVIHFCWLPSLNGYELQSLGDYYAIHVLEIKIYFRIRKGENPHIFWSSVRAYLLPYSVKLLFLLGLMDAAIISHICPFKCVSTAFATCKRCRNSVKFSSGSKVICLHFIPSWNSNIFTFQKYQEKNVWPWPLSMPLYLPSEGQGRNDKLFEMKSRAKSLTPATPGAASTCHEFQAWQLWGVLRSLVLRPWTQKTLA